MTASVGRRTISTYNHTGCRCEKCFTRSYSFASCYLFVWMHPNGDYIYNTDKLSLSLSFAKTHGLLSRCCSSSCSQHCCSSSVGQGRRGRVFVNAPAVSAGVHVWALSRAGGARAPSTWRTAQPSITPRTSPSYCYNYLLFFQRGLDPLAYRRGGDGTVVFPGALFQMLMNIFD